MAKPMDFPVESLRGMPDGGHLNSQIVEMVSKEGIRRGHSMQWNYNICLELTLFRAADATSHLFFAYLRSLSPESAQGKSSILNLPISLQQLLESTEYPLAPQEVVQRPTSKVVMIVETVSPTPFALLRRAKNFHYREEDYVLQEFSDYDDPVAALTDECKRVLKSIATANESTTSKTSTSLRDASWSRFEDIGFSGFSEDFDAADEPEQSVLGRKTPQVQGLRTTPANKTTDLGRPTTPSWADFLSSGFNKDAPGGGNPALLLPPDKQLPPINTRSQTSQSHRRGIDDESMLEPGELASIVAFSFDDTFWWVWMTSLAGEETPTRKSAFGRCALVETSFSRGWLIMEEIIKGAAPEPEAGAYIAEKKSRFGFSRRTKISRSKSSGKNNQSKADAVGRSNMVSPASKTSIAPDQQARVQAAAAALQQRNKAQQAEEPLSPRRARQTEEMSMKTNSVLTLQPMLMNEAAQAMKWANSYDKNAIRAKYLGDNFAGRGSNISLLNGGMSSANNASTTQIAGANGNPGQGAQQFANKENVPPVPPKKPGSPEPRDESRAYPGNNTALLEMLNKGPPGGPGGGRSRSVQEASQLQDKSTPGLPVAPAVPSKERSAQEEVVPAAIPLPGDTPAPSTPTAQKPPMPEEYPRRMERKPVQSTAGKENQPPQAANAQDSIEKSSANGKAAVAPPSPESPKHNKLKKKNPQGGFKGIFGRKKAEPPAKDPPPRSVSSSSAVAAARAALEAKATQNQKPPEPSSKSNAKRFSVGRKKEAESAPEPVRTAPTVPEEPEERQAPVPQHEAHDHAQRNQSTVDSEEQRAEREFSKFDQGPLEDVPAFVPEDNPHEQAEHFAPSEVDQEYDDEINTGDVSPARISEDDGAELTRTISPNDRWAQIRKNAADRAAMRQSEEQSRRTDRTDDDGDTSGEESK